MRPYLPWWMAMLLGLLALPYVVVIGIAKIVAEVMHDLRVARR